MKQIIIAAIAALSFFTFNAHAQTTQSKGATVVVSIPVEGACNMCEKRIEDAAYIKGVKRAEWDKNSKQLKLVYNRKKTSIDQIAKSVAQAGHTAGEHSASEESYTKLPACCAYREVEAH